MRLARLETGHDDGGIVVDRDDEGRAGRALHLDLARRIRLDPDDGVPA
jgi:hypothetical protein